MTPMKHETTSPADEDSGGTATIRPQPVSDELIARLAGRCEAIFPLNGRVRHEISDEEIHEMESLLKRFRPAPAKILFREQCCALMCAESEREMEYRLKKFSPSPVLEFSVCKMAGAMNAAQEEKQEKAVPSRLWKRLAYISGISVAAAVGGVLMMQNLLDTHGGAAPVPEMQAATEKAPLPPRAEEKEHAPRKPTVFELQGGDERVPVLAPSAIRKILPQKEY